MAEGVRNDEEFSGTRPVEERHRIDEIALDGWMREHVEGYRTDPRGYVKAIDAFLTSHLTP